MAVSRLTYGIPLMTLPPPAEYNTEPGDEIDLWAVWQTLLEGKLILITTTVVFLALATSVAFLMTQKYEAKVVFTFPDDGKYGPTLGAMAGHLGGLADLAGMGTSGGSNKEASLAYLRSRIMLEGFIKENDLLPILYSKKWDVATKKWRTDDSEDIPTLWKAYELWTKRIFDLQYDKKANIATLTITWKNREQAVAWANGFIARANANLREKTIAETQLTLSYLEKELQKTSVVEVQNTIFKVMENQFKTMMMANTQEQFAFKVIDPAQVVDEDAFVKPNRPMIVGIGGFAGLFFGILAIFIRRAIRNRN
jgi:LPS O-antigen subunit length determinant protein (WzzB/FepE family)